MRYAFINEHRHLCRGRLLCNMLDVHPSGFYAWSKQSSSKRDKANLRLTGLIKQFWLESGCVYGYRKIHSDLRAAGERCGINRICRLMQSEGLKAQVGYCKSRYRKGDSHNRLQRQFNLVTPGEVLVTDITYIRTHEAWLYLAVVVDLFSRNVVGWSMHSQISKDIVLNALLMAVLRREPKKQLMEALNSKFESETSWQIVVAGRSKPSVLKRKR